MQKQPQGKNYRIFVDPYKKHLQVELYEGVKFSKLIYDSRFLDFRELSTWVEKPWRRLCLSESQDFASYAIQNEEERCILVEKTRFEGEDPVLTELFSAHGILLAKQRIFYRRKGDDFDGLTFEDPAARLVLRKEYEVDANGVFSNLLAMTY